MSEEITDITDVVLDHMMNPRNYGEIKDPDCCGIGYDEGSGEYVVVYLKVKEGKIEDFKFSAQACQDTIVAGSMFSEMVLGDTLENAKKALNLVKEKIKDAPSRQRACTSLVLTAFEACLINYENRLSGVDEELHKLKMKESCEIGEESE